MACHDTPVVEASRLEYEQRVNRVIDHVRAHLAEELSLDRLARVAAFSPFHFHRIFRAITGETLSAFVQRLRLERAALALVHHRDESVLAVALDHGFSSAATFARAFRAHFSMSATAWRAGGARHWGRPRPPDRKPGKANRKPSKAAPRRQRHGGSRVSRKEAAMHVTVRELPRYRVAYMRHVGPYGPHGIPELWERFRKWAERRGLGGPDAIKLGIAHDDPEVTPPEKCRYDACIVVPDGFAGDKWVNLADVPGGTYGVAEFVGSPDTIREGWEVLYRSWLPGSGYQPDDRPCLEIYRGNPAVDRRPGAFRCELCVPVRPL
jgi:AraC family transcriptional regulator